MSQNWINETVAHENEDDDNCVQFSVTQLMQRCSCSLEFEVSHVGVRRLGSAGHLAQGDPIPIRTEGPFSVSTPIKSPDSQKTLIHLSRLR